MARARKIRTPTTQEEQAILASFIMRFFEAPDRSDERAEIVRQVLAAIHITDREWNARSVRLWFNNNRRTYLAEARPVQMQAMMVGIPPTAQPIPFPYGYVPMQPQPMQAPLFWAPAIPILQPPPPPPLQQKERTDGQEEQPPSRTVHFPPVPDFPPPR
jgi:hypothetical protein